MKRVVLFDELYCRCAYFDGNDEITVGFACNHPRQELFEEETGKRQGKCTLCCCPLGMEAEAEDLNSPDVDWDGLCSDEDVCGNGYFMIDIGADATEEQKAALYKYDGFMHRYDTEWLANHRRENEI